MFGMLPFERSDDNLFDTSAPTFGTPETSLS